MPQEVRFTSPDGAWKSIYFQSEIYSQPRHLGIFQNASEYLLQFEEDAAINVGPSALRKWRRSKVDFLLQVLLFVHTSITKLRSSSSETKASQNLALKEVVETNGFVKVLVKSFLSLESFETEPARREARISATLGWSFEGAEFTRQRIWRQIASVFEGDEHQSSRRS